MANTESITLTLSQEEVVYLLTLIEVAFIPGLGPTPLGDATGEQAQAALASAERSLIARNIVAITTDDKREIASSVMGLVGTCAYPAKSLLLNWEPTDGASSIAAYFHVAEEGITVEHVVIADGIHQFTAYATVQDGIIRLTELINISDRRTMSDMQIVLDEGAQNYVRNSLARAIQPNAQQTLITQYGINGTAAEALVQSMSHLTMIVELISIEHDPGHTKLNNYVLYISSMDSWMLEIVSTGSAANGKMTPIETAALRRWLEHLLTPAS